VPDVADPIKVDGLDQFLRELDAMDRALPKALRLAMGTAAQIVVDDARPRIPSLSGAARGSVRVQSAETFARVIGGSTRAPYYPWLDFGGAVGRNNSIRRPYLKDGRYIYRAHEQNQGRYVEVLTDALRDAAAQAGIELD
jgi:hypothetical protein